MSTTIGVRLKEQIKNDLNTLLGRGRTVYPCPLGQGEQRKFWHNTFPADTIHALNTLEQQGYATYSMTCRYVGVITTINCKQYDIKFTTPSDAHTWLLTDPNIKGRLHHRTDLSIAYPGTHWSEFVAWVEGCAQIERDFSNAWAAFDKILAFCGTVGQLVQAIPELRTHLPGKSQAALAEQQRKSNMPFEWAVFPRDKIENLQLSICKAFLFPRTDSGSWTNFAGTWAKDADI